MSLSGESTQNNPQKGDAMELHALNISLVSDHHKEGFADFARIIGFIRGILLGYPPKAEIMLRYGDQSVFH